MRALGAVAIILSLSSCSRRTTETGEAQRIKVLASIDQIRASFNSGACLAIYDSASRNFRNQDSTDWLSRCAELKQSFGSWSTFSLTNIWRPPDAPEVFVIAGTAQFDRKSAEIGFSFHLTNGSVRLDTISFRKTERQWENIPDQFLRRFPRFQDPLPPKSPSDSSS
jgi:hypothetical protein